MCSCRCWGSLGYSWPRLYLVYHSARPPPGTRVYIVADWHLLVYWELDLLTSDTADYNHQDCNTHLPNNYPKWPVRSAGSCWHWNGTLVLVLFCRCSPHTPPGWVVEGTVQRSSLFLPGASLRMRTACPWRCENCWRWGSRTMTRMKEPSCSWETGVCGGAGPWIGLWSFGEWRSSPDVALEALRHRILWTWSDWTELKSPETVVEADWPCWRNLWGHTSHCIDQYSLIQKKLFESFLHRVCVCACARVCKIINRLAIILT